MVLYKGNTVEDLLKTKPEVKVLTDWAKEPTVLDLKKDLEQCQSFHSKHVGNLNKWEAAFNIQPIPENKEQKAQSRIAPKLIRKQYEWRCAGLSEPFLSTPDLFKLKPVSHEDMERVKQDELILNFQFQNQLSKVPFIDKFIRTTAKQGTAIIRTGWEYLTKEVKTTKPVYEYFFCLLYTSPSPRDRG